MAVVLGQGVSIARPFAARRIVGKLRRRKLAPCLNNRCDDAPLGFHFIAPGEQRRIASHCIQQERLISHRPGCSARMCGPGVLAPKFTAMPSFGWIRIVMTLWWTSSWLRANRACGVRLKCTAISVTWLDNRLPART